MKRILTIFGTRPEAIKLAPVIAELERHPDRFESVVAVTAQHREMLDQVLRIFEIKPDIDLDLMRPGQTLFDLTSRGLLGLEQILVDVKPDLVLVQGDTTTTFVGALAAFYLRIPVGHIEAGLRTFNKRQPFPEEINRQLTSTLADYHFAPTAQSQGNLVSEGIDEGKVFVTGNTIVDALQTVMGTNMRVASDGGRQAAGFPTLRAGASRDFRSPGATYLDGLSGRRLVVVTAHRRENWGSPLKNICRALLELERRRLDIDIVFSVHPNPEVQETVRAMLKGTRRIDLTPPLDYVTFVRLMNESCLILTDSGGIQEEAPSLGKPVLVMRRSTERPEVLDLGLVSLVGTDTETIVREASRVLDAPPDDGPRINPFGDGRAAERIVSILGESLT